MPLLPAWGGLCHCTPGWIRARRERIPALTPQCPSQMTVRKQPNRKTSETASLCYRCQSLLPAPNMHVCQAQRRVWIYCRRSVLRMRCKSRGLLHQPRRTRRTSRTDYENQPTSRSLSPLPPDSFSCPSQGCKLLWIIAVTFIRTVAAYLCLRGGSGA